MDRGIIAISEDDTFEMGEHAMAEAFGVTVEVLHKYIEDGTSLPKGTRYYYFDYTL